VGGARLPDAESVWKTSGLEGGLDL
jgi:hypothetical protein